MTRDDDTNTTKGAGLARGPALIVGAILAGFGLVLFLHAGDTPTGAFPDGDARGARLLGFESNGWTAWFTTAAGALLLFGAAQHLLAKTISLIVGLALAACAVIALVSGPGVLGLAAANHAVELGWAIAAVILLLNVFAPRIRRRDDARAAHEDRVAPRPAAADPEPTRLTDSDGSPIVGEAPARASDAQRPDAHDDPTVARRPADEQGGPPPTHEQGGPPPAR